jgi:hypothetical protein
MIILLLNAVEYVSMHNNNTNSLIMQVTVIINDHNQIIINELLFFRYVSPSVKGGVIVSRNQM